VIGIVTDIWGSVAPGVQLHAPILVSHVTGTVFAVVAAWLAIGTVVELRRYPDDALAASNASGA
jgi:hypothetical protein